VHGLLGSLRTSPAGFHATINADRYYGTLSHLQATLRKKRLGILMDNVVLLHDNTRPHVANRTAARLQSFGSEIMDHAPYSPDLSPSDLPRVRSTEEVSVRAEVHFRR
jgi:transposase